MNSTASLTAFAASEKRSATGCTGVAVAIAACSRLAWNGSSPCPVEVVPSGKIATTWPARERGGDGVDDAQGIALSFALEVERARRIDQPRHQRPRLDVCLGDEARLRDDGMDRHDVEPGDVVDDEQAAGSALARPRARRRCRARRASSSTTSGSARGAPRCRARGTRTGRSPGHAGRGRRRARGAPRRGRAASPRHSTAS